jgi:malate dehydrogenase
MDTETIDAICKRTASGGGEIVKLLEKGSAFYAPGSAAAIMAESILNDRKRSLPCSAYLSGQYGLDDIYIGVPVVLGKNGVEQIVELELEEFELKSLHESAGFYKEQLSGILGY